MECYFPVVFRTWSTGEVDWSGLMSDCASTESQLPTAADCAASASTQCVEAASRPHLAGWVTAPWIIQRQWRQPWRGVPNEPRVAAHPRCQQTRLISRNSGEDSDHGAATPTAPRSQTSPRRSVGCREIKSKSGRPAGERPDGAIIDTCPPGRADHNSAARASRHYNGTLQINTLIHAGRPSSTKAQLPLPLIIHMKRDKCLEIYRPACAQASIARSISSTCIWI